MKISRIWAAVLATAFAAGAAQADTIIQAVAKRTVKHNDAKINGIEGDQLLFTVVGRNTKVNILDVVQVDVPANKELTEAERLRADGSLPAAAAKYEQVVVINRPAWTPTFARIRLVDVYARDGQAEKMAKAFIDLYRANPKESVAVAGGDPILTTKAGDKEKGEKLVRDAMTAAVGRDTAPLRVLLGRLTGKDDPSLKTKDDPPVVGKTPVGKEKDTPKNPVEKVNPAGSDEPALIDVAANIKEAGPAEVAELERLYKSNSFAGAAERYKGLELGLSADVKQAEAFYISGGMACIKAAEKVIADIDRLRVEADRAVGGAAQEKFRDEARKLERIKKDHLTYAAIALSEAVRLPGTEKKKMAEPTFWCAWALEQLDRPLQARSLYSYFVANFEKDAPEEIFKRGKAGFDRLAQGS